MKKLLCLLTVFALFLSSCGQKAEKKETTASDFNKEEAAKSMSAYKSQIDKARQDKKLKQKLREDIGLKSFNAEEIEISEAELWYEGQQIVQIDVRFYSGAPMGTKHWYIKDGSPLGVEFADFMQEEDGSIKEKIIFTLLYDKNSDSWVAAGGEPKMDKLKAEMSNEWSQLKGLAEKYKPKAE